MEAHDPIHEYIIKNSSPESELLKELTRQTHLRKLRSRMLSGHIQGRVLSLLSKLKSPKTILEVGTFTGYSAICLAEGLQTGGKLHTIDIDDEIEALASQFIDQSPRSDDIKIHIGDALDIIPKLLIQPDLVFLDADKKDYTKLLDIITPNLAPKALVLIDNTLWSGKVLEPTPEDDPQTQGILTFNSYAATHPLFETILLPIRDGLTAMQLKK